MIWPNPPRLEPRKLANRVLRAKAFSRMQMALGDQASRADRTSWMQAWTARQQPTYNQSHAARRSARRKLAAAAAAAAAGGVGVDLPRYSRGRRPGKKRGGRRHRNIANYDIKYCPTCSTKSR